MKKLFFMLVAALMAVTATFAQSTLVATLTHGENVTMYYGTYALRDAHNAAVSGDVINLSGGSFQPVTITKAVSLRGTGIDEAVPTSITGEFTINIPSSVTERFSMEGVRCQSRVDLRGTYNNPYFLKCQFTEIVFNYSPDIKNAMFVNCKITSDICSLNGNCSVQFVNSYVSGFINGSESTSSASFVNCVVRPRYNSPASLKSCQLMNCILYKGFGTYESSPLPNTTIASNCVAINGNGWMNIFDNSQVNPHCGYAVYSEMFKDFAGEYSDSQTFELSAEGKTRQLGTDGSEIGLYGGLMPYTSIPSYPRITKMNVANKTTADGKLSVEIEVSAAQ